MLLKLCLVGIIDHLEKKVMQKPPVAVSMHTVSVCPTVFEGQTAIVFTLCSY